MREVENLLKNIDNSLIAANTDCARDGISGICMEKSMVVGKAWTVDEYVGVGTNLD